MRKLAYLSIILSAWAIGLAIVGLVGSIDYSEELAEEMLYCEMVEAGHWPDYKEHGHAYCVELLAGKWEIAAE